LFQDDSFRFFFGYKAKRETKEQKKESRNSQDQGSGSVIPQKGTEIICLINPYLQDQQLRKRTSLTFQILRQE